MEVYYQVTVAGRYKCGACDFLTYDVKTLHFHVKQHSDGSYFFCQESNTMFPRFKSLEATTQTELLVEVTSDDIIRTGNSLRFIPELDTSVSQPESVQESQLSEEQGSQLAEDQESQLPEDQGNILPEDQGNQLPEEQTSQLPEVKAVDPGATPLPEAICQVLEDIDYAEIEEAVIKQEGGNPLVEIPLSYKSMSSDELLNVLLNEEPHVLDQNKGKKNYMVIHTDGYKMGMFDDGVSWESHTRKSTKQCYAIDEDHKLSQIFKKGSSYYVKRMHNRQHQYELLQPQPTTIVTFQKVSVNLQGNDSYRRRITTVVEAPFGLEYISNKGVVEYYMDITSIQKMSGGEGNVNVTLPNCARLKEMLYPGICPEVPGTSTPIGSSDQSLEWTATGPKVVEVEDLEGNLMEVTVNPKGPARQPIVTGYQYMNNEEQLQVLMNEHKADDDLMSKNYRIFTSKNKGFQKQDVYGAWRISSTSNLTLSVADDNKLTPVTKRGNTYYILDWKNKNEVGVELSPQPKDLLVLQRCSFKLAESNMFRKRETIVWSAPDRLASLRNKHLVEYCGTKCLVPKVKEDENGKTMLVVPQQVLYPYEGDIVDEDGCALNMSNMACTYMSNEELLERLILDDTEQSSPYSCGKNYMVIKNERQFKKTQFYLKDGCVWNSRAGTTINQSFTIDDENNIKGVIKKGDLYCLKKRYNRKLAYEPLSPQPSEILTFHKYSTALKSNSMYKKRVTSVTEAPERLEYLKSKVLVEYYMDKSNQKTPLSVQSKTPLDRLKWQLENMKSELISDGNHPVKRKFDEITDENEENLKVREADQVANDPISSQEDVVEDDEENEGMAVQLPIASTFMNAREIWKTLSTYTGACVSSVLSANHDKDYIVLSGDDGDDNINSAAYQDGLFWDGVNFGVTKQDFILESGNIGKLVTRRDGLFYGGRKENKQTVYEILKPQPKQTVTFIRSWSRLKSMPWYRKRVTKLTNLPEEYTHLKSYVLVEYSLERAKKTGIEDDVDLLNSIKNKDSNPKRKIEDIREMLDLDELNLPEPVVVETQSTPLRKGAELMDTTTLTTLDASTDSPDKTKSTTLNVNTDSPDKTKSAAFIENTELSNKSTELPNKTKETPHDNRTESPNKTKAAPHKKRKESLSRTIATSLSKGRESLPEKPKSRESLYEKPYLKSPDVSRVCRSERLKQRQIKRIKMDQEEQEENTEEVSANNSPESKNVNGDDEGQMMSIDTLFETLQSKETFSSVKERPLNKSFILLEIEPDAPDRKKLLNDNFLWNSNTGTTANQTFRVSPDNKLTLLVKKKGKYCARIPDASQPCKFAYKPLKPQPKDIVILHRYFVKGKSAQTFVKRVTSVKEAPERLSFLKSRVLVEYSTSYKSCYKKSM